MSVGGSTNPVIVPEDLKFYLSGGYFNSEPEHSIGGPISSYAIASGAMHGLFDRIDTVEATEGDVEFRCIYLRNTSQTRKLLNTRIWIETGTASANTAINISIGSGGINGTEPLITEEGNAPPMQFFEVPLTEPDEPNIGDLYPGDHIGLWVAWIVRPGTTSITNDFAVLRIDGEREPESLTDPLPPVQGTDPPTTGCPSGSKWSPIESKCVPDSTTIICPNGYTYNSTTQRCVPPTTPPPSITQIRFAAAGDFSCTSDNTASMASIKQRLIISSDDMFLALGDFSYEDGDQSCWIESTQTLTGIYPNRIAPVIGNHDDVEDGEARDRTSIINTYPLIPAEGYYAFTKRNIRFIMMDTQKSYSSGSAQHTFVVAELNKAIADPNIKWKIVCYHKPSMISDTDHSILTDLRDLYHPLFDQYKVDLILTGHAHVYFRSVPVKYLSTDSDKVVPQSTQKSGTYINIDGRIFATIGTGGRRSNHEFGDSTDYVGFRSVPDPYGVLFITLEDNGTKLHGQYISNGGQVLDDFTQSKPNASTPPPIVCPTGFNWNETLGQCVISPTTCPEGYTWSPSQNKCIANSGTPPPPSGPVDPMQGVTWYYDSTQTQNSAQTITAGNYDATEGIILSSPDESVASTVISGGYINVKSGDGLGRIYIDYWKKTRWTQDTQAKQNVAGYFTFVYENQISISIYDGNHPSLNFTPNTTFGGFGFNLIGPFPTTSAAFKNQSNSQVSYWVNPSNFNLGQFGETISSIYPGGRSFVNGRTYKVFFTNRTNRTNGSVVQNVWVDFADGTGWVKIQTNRTWSLSNWNPINVPAGKTDTTQIETGPAAIERRHIQIRNNNTDPPVKPDLRIKDIKIGTLPYLPETTTPPPNQEPPPSGNPGTGVIDGNGIEWLQSSGTQGVIAQSRNQSDDDRWSGNVSNMGDYGYEATMYLTISGMSSDGHFAMKMWGPNHSGDCGYEQDGDCCCWYDLGVRFNGDIQQQVEVPHPNNDDFSKGKLMTNIGRGLNNATTGLKWLVYPKNVGGSGSNGGVRVKMWVDTSGFSNGRPQNQWRLAMDFTDTGDVLPSDYPNPDFEQDLEIRNSDTNSNTAYAGGLHWKKRTANDSRTA